MIKVSLPKEPTPEQARAYLLAILEAWENGLERGYTLTIEEEAN
jgi:hypothetical protein